MPSTLTKVTTDIAINGVIIPSNSVQISHKLNDIPTAQVNLIPRDDDEKELIQGLPNQSFSEVEIIINGELLFKGFFVGLHSQSTSNGISIDASFYGGPYKLSQAGIGTLGLHSLSGHNNLIRTMINTPRNKDKFLSGILVDPSDDIFTVFKKIMDRMLDTIRTDLITAKGSQALKSKVNEVLDAVLDLYEFHANKNDDIVSQELAKITILPGLSTNVLKIVDDLVTQNIILQFGANPSMSFWDFLVILCENYQIAIGTHNDKTFAIPYDPMGDSVDTISPNDVISISVSPFPRNVPTRAYLSLSDPTSDTLFGSFPELDEANKATPLEEKLGTVKSVFYTLPGWLLHHHPVLDVVNSARKASKRDILESKAILNLYAEQLTFKEIFKHRTGKISLRYSGSRFVVGTVVTFVDPFFGITYEGLILQVSHHAASRGSIGTVLDLAYVVSNSEKELLGLKDRKNPIYPNFNSSQLIGEL